MEFANSIYDIVFGQTDFTVDGKCSGCGECCSDFLPMTKTEIEVVKRYIKKHNIKEFNAMPKVVTNGMNMTCPFRDEKQKICTIYPVRPSICKAFLCSHRTEDIARNKTLSYTKDYKIVFMRKEFFDSDADKGLIDNFLYLKEVL